MSIDSWKSDEGVLDTRLVIRKYCLKMMLIDKEWKEMVRQPKASPPNTPIANIEDDNDGWGSDTFEDSNSNDRLSDTEVCWDEFGNEIMEQPSEEEDDNNEMSGVEDGSTSNGEEGTDVISTRSKPAITTLPGSARKKKAKRSRSSEVLNSGNDSDLDVLL
jgi:hypothetical protein